MIDTCVFLYAFQTKKEYVEKNIRFIVDCKKIIGYITQGKIQACISSRVKHEVKKKEKDSDYDGANMLELIESLPVLNSVFRYDFSAYDEDIMMSNQGIKHNSEIQGLIKRKKSKSDTDILHCTSFHSINCFITTNEKDFIKKDDTRKNLEEVRGVQIFRPSEFLKFYELSDD